MQIEEKKLPKNTDVSYPPIRGTMSYGSPSTTSSTANSTSEQKKDGADNVNNLKIFPEDDSAWDDFQLKDQSQEFKLQGDNFFREKKWRHAVESYSKSLEFKKDPIVFCNRAAAYFQLKDYDEAERDCESSILLHGQYAKAFTRRALIRKAQKRYMEAIQDFERSLVIESNEAVQQQLNETKQLYLKSEAEKPKKRLIVEESDDESNENEEVNDANTKNEIVENKISETPSKNITEIPTEDQESSKPVQNRRMIIEESDDSDIEELVTSGAQAIREQQRKIEEDNKKQLFKVKSDSSEKYSTTKTPPSTPTTPASFNTTDRSPSPTQVFQNITQDSSDKSQNIENKVTEINNVEKTEKNEQIQSSTFKEKQLDLSQSLESLPNIKGKIPNHPPTGIYEFHQVYKELNDDEFAEYLKIFDPKSLPKLFADDLSPENLERIIRAISDKILLTGNDSDYLFALDMIEQLTKVNRFSMTIMFFEEEEQKVISRLFERLEDKSSKFNTSDRINTLKDQYEAF